MGKKLTDVVDALTHRVLGLSSTGLSCRYMQFYPLCVQLPSYMVMALGMAGRMLCLSLSELENLSISF